MKKKPTKVMFPKLRAQIRTIFIGLSAAILVLALVMAAIR